MLSSEGKIIGFQPTSRVAVNHWSANPLAKELYSGRKLSPGKFSSFDSLNFNATLILVADDDDDDCVHYRCYTGLIEPGLKSGRPPTKVVVLELLMSVNSDRPFALVRPLLPQ